MGKASQISSTNHLNNNNKTRISGNFCREQIELASKAVIFNATAPLKPDEPKTEGSPAPQHNNKPITLVGGLDITPVQPAAPQNWPFTPEPAVACLVIISMPDLSTVYEDQITIQLQVPYIPSYLGFREVPAFKQLITRAQNDGFTPDLLLIDGFGQLHPRRCGSATHLGVVCGVPTVGVAKDMLHLEGLTARGAREAIFEAQAALPSAQEACSVPLRNENGEILGAAVCPPGTKKPIFVSAGHLVSLETAVDVVIKCCKYRIPEPIRQADQRSREAARKLLALGGLASNSIERTL